MRAYLSADADMLRTLLGGGTIAAVVNIPAGDDEVDEFDAMAAAAASGRVVVAVDVDHAEQPVDLRHVAAFHVDVDGSGDLAWYAPQEIDQVLALLEGEQ